MKLFYARPRSICYVANPALVVPIVSPSTDRKNKQETILFFFFCWFLYFVSFHKRRIREYILHYYVDSRISLETSTFLHSDIERKKRWIDENETNLLLINYIFKFNINSTRFLPGFAPFVDGTVIVNPATTATSPLTLPAGSAIARWVTFVCIYGWLTLSR